MSSPETAAEVSLLSIGMARDGKRTEVLKLNLTEREFIDLSRLAAVEQRPLGEYAARVLRGFMYGSVATRLAAVEQALRDSEVR